MGAYKCGFCDRTIDTIRDSFIVIDGETPQCNRCTEFISGEKHF